MTCALLGSSPCQPSSSQPWTEQRSIAGVLHAVQGAHFEQLLFQLTGWLALTCGPCRCPPLLQARRHQSRRATSCRRPEEFSVQVRDAKWRRRDGGGEGDLDMLRYFRGSSAFRTISFSREGAAWPLFMSIYIFISDTIVSGLLPSLCASTGRGATALPTRRPTCAGAACVGSGAASLCGQLRAQGLTRALLDSAVASAPRRGGQHGLDRDAPRSA